MSGPPSPSRLRKKVSNITTPLPSSASGSSASSTTPASPGLSTPSKLILVAIVTSCWYWCSSVNAIASQKLFHRVLQELSENNYDDGYKNNNNDNNFNGQIFVPFLVTTMQLFTGSIVSIICLCFFLPKSNNKDPTTPSLWKLFLQQFTRRKHFAIGLFHFIGCLSTNISFGYGSAVLVQVIKLLEPIETLLLTALVTRSMESLSGRKVFSTIMIIFGTTMLLGQQKKSSSLMEQNSYTMCVYFALSSGFCMASRNVLTKKKDDKVREQQQDDDDEESASSIITTTNTCREVFQKGLLNFATITIMSTLPAIIAISFYPWHYPKLLQLMLQHPPPPPSSESNQSLLPQTVIFHCLYNMASITVLSLTSAPVHSLLNVGKRIANVIFASMVFGIIIPKEGKMGLIIVGVGTLIYNDKILAMLCSSGGGGGRRREKSSLHRMTVHHGRVNVV